MPELTRETFIALWTSAKSGQSPSDPELARMQKFMMMHDDMHPHFERIAQEPSASLAVDGENLALHIAMDAATEASLERGEPEGIRDVMQGMLDASVDPGIAFHAISQAMQHEFLSAAAQEQEMDLGKFLARAMDYARQAVARSSKAS